MSLTEDCYPENPRRMPWRRYYPVRWRPAGAAGRWIQYCHCGWLRARGEKP